MPTHKPAPKPVIKPQAPTGARTPQSVGDAALDGIRYNLAPLYAAGWKIVFHPYAGTYLGLTDSGTKTINVYITATETVAYATKVLAHEIGHAVDFQYSTDATHTAYLKARGLDPHTPWYGCDRCTDFATPAGDWAEVFAYWQTHNPDFRSQMAGIPTPAQLAKIVPLFTDH